MAVIGRHAGRRAPAAIPLAAMVAIVACSATERAAEQPAAADVRVPELARPSPVETSAARTAPSPLPAPAPSARVATAASESGPARPAAGFTFGTSVGVLQGSRDAGTCLVIADADLEPGDTLLVVRLERPQGVGVARIEGRRAKPCTEPGDEWGSVSIEHASHYNVSIVSGTSGDPAIALRSEARLAVEDDLVTGDVDGDGRPERFTSCTSREGIHLRVTTRVADGGTLERWHGYFYVPYDLEPDCSER